MSSAVLPFPQLNSTSFLVTLSQTASRAASIAYKPLDLVSDLVARGLFRVLDVAIPEGREVVLNAAGGGGPMETEMAAAAAVGAGAAARESARAAEVAALNALPGPWTFATSSFALSLLAMAVLVNRIHHLVPPRRPTSLHLSPLLRLSIRLPSLLLLLRAIFLLTAVLGTHHGYSFGRITDVGVGAVKLLGWGTAWAGKSTLVGLLDKWEVVDGKIMWEVFVGTAAAVVTETFVRALDDDIGSQTHFSLLSFSFLLHIHSTPSPTRLATTPTQLYIHLLAVLSELFTLHLSYSFTPPLPSLRFLITAIFSFLGQAFVVRGIAMAWGKIDLVDAEGPWAGTVWLSRAPEMAFEALAVLTIALRLLAAVLRSEEITSEAVLGHPAHYPRLDQDFAVEMIKYGAACLESTRLAGLANEVDPISAGPLALSSGAHVSFVELSRGATSGEVGVRKAAGEEVRKGGKGEGLKREVGVVEAVRREEQGERDTRREDKLWEMIKYFRLVGRIVFFVAWMGYVRLRNWAWRTARKAGWGGDEAALSEQWRATGGPEADDEADQDWLPSPRVSRSETPGSDSSDGSSSSSDEEENSEVEDDFSPSALYSDLSSPARRPASFPTPSTSNALTPYEPADSYGPVLLAHHFSSGSPLTRRRYQALASPGFQAFSSAVMERREEVARKEWGGQKDEGRQRCCVVCQVEERSIICWPCRCLAMCEECREHLAERTPAAQHLCPTCRTPIMGFSRIFIP